METAVLTPLPENHSDPTQAMHTPQRSTAGNAGRHRRPDNRHEGRHRTPEQPGLRHRARRAAAFLMRRNQAQATPAAVPEAAPVQAAPEVQAPQPIALEHAVGAREQLLPSKNTVTVTAHAPILTREQVQGQLGFDMGALQAVVHLPGATKPVYCFNNSTVNDRGDPLPRFTFANQEQLGQLSSMYDTGRPGWDEISEGMLFMSREPNEQGKMREQQSIGRARWVPGLPQGVRHEHAVPVDREYAKVAERQVNMRIDETGALNFNELAHGRHHTVVEVNPLPAAAQDPWAAHPVLPMHADGFWQRNQ